MGETRAHANAPLALDDEEPPALVLEKASSPFDNHVGVLLIAAAIGGAICASQGFLPWVPVTPASKPFVAIVAMLAIAIPGIVLAHFHAKGEGYVELHEHELLFKGHRHVTDRSALRVPWE